VELERRLAGWVTAVGRGAEEGRRPAASVSLVRARQRHAKLESSGGGAWRWLALGGAGLERAMRWRRVAWMCERDAGAARRAVAGCAEE
jgi:hypothetical protein